MDSTKGILVDISYDGLHWSRAKFSPDYNYAGSITATDSAGGRLFMSILKGQNKGDLYLSNYNGTYFTKTLENNFNFDGTVDKNALEALESVHFANTLENNKLNSVSSWDNGHSWFPIHLNNTS